MTDKPAGYLIKMNKKNFKNSQAEEMVEETEATEMIKINKNKHHLKEGVIAVIGVIEIDRQMMDSNKDSIKVGETDKTSNQTLKKENMVIIKIIITADKIVEILEAEGLDLREEEVEDPIGTVGISIIIKMIIINGKTEDNEETITIIISHPTICRIASQIK